jgi:hypothetical protein
VLFTNPHKLIVLRGKGQFKVMVVMILLVIYFVILEELTSLPFAVLAIFFGEED